jgi:hypothetical protein
MSESEFIERIDCRFPYRRQMEWRRLSARAARISANAAFMVVHEACRPPRSVELGADQARAIVSHLRRRFRHPLLRVLAPAIQAHISGRELRPSKAASLMRKVAAHADQYNALALCYLCADDSAGVLDQIYNQVVSKWRRV